MMQEAAVQTQLWAQTPSAISAQVDDTTEEQETESLSGDERYDIVIMNPPFTRADLRHDQLGVALERKIKDREKELFENSVIGLGDSAGMFLELANKLLDRNNGSLGLVLPAGVTCGKSGRPKRNLLIDNFHLEYVIASQDPKRPNFSENTTISEMLIILRKKIPNSTPEDVKFVRLSRNPDRPSLAIPAVKSIRQGDTSGFSGTITLWPHERVEQDDWTPIKFFSSYLAAKSWEWFIQDSSNKFELLGEVASVGPEGRRIRDAFIRSDASDEKGRQGMWLNDQSDVPKAEGTKICMEQTPDSYINAKPARADYADKIWEKRANLLLPAKIRTTSVLTGAIISTYPVLGSAWIPIRHKTEPVGCDWEKAMCVYLNSTTGFLASLSTSSPFVIGMPKMSLDGQRKIPIPKLDKAQTTHLAAIYDTHKHTRLDRLRYPDSEPRIALDQAIADTIDIPIDQINTARRELAEEPGITGRPHKSVKG